MEQAIEPIAPADAKAMLDRGEAVAVDVREAGELAATGKVPGALHIPRAVLASAADPEAAGHDPRLKTNAAIILYCGSGKRSELAGLTLRGLGYQRVFNLGGLKDWVEAGLSVER